MFQECTCKPGADGLPLDLCDVCDDARDFGESAPVEEYEYDQEP